MNENLSSKMNKNRIIGILILVIICGAGYFIFSKYSTADKDIKSKELTFSAGEKTASFVLKDFDPNELDAAGWIGLGFTEHQANTILNWKDVLGGSFSTKGQLKKCYAITPEKYAEIESYIQLPETKTNNYQKNSYQQYSPQSYTPKNQIQPKVKFNPDNYTASDWQNIGFSEKQAISIVKYKNYLGGSFTSKEKFRECFMISPENYAKLAPFLILPDSTPVNFDQNEFAKSSIVSKSKISYNTFDPNDLTLEGWISLGFSEKQANSILKYKDKVLKGKFKSLEDVKACYMITETKFDELKPFILLDNRSAQASEHTSGNTPTERTNINFAALELNEISAEQLIDFGFDKRSANGFVGLRKSLGGFVQKNQIFETYNIDRDLAEKLIATVPLNSSKAQKYTLVNAPESWLKTHPYFKYSADKIIYYRISNSDEKKIWKFLSTKPEYEAKMRMYLN